MRRYTTPTLPLTVRGADLTACDVWVTITQGAYRLERKVECSYDGTDTTIELTLTQEETGALKRGKSKVQVNWIDAQGRRDATRIREVDVAENLQDRVVGYGD